MFLKKPQMVFSAFSKFLHLAYYTICVHLLCIQPLNLSLFPFSSHSHTPGRSEGKWQLNFLSVAVCGIGKSSGPQCSPLSHADTNADLIHSPALPLPHILVSKSPPLHSWNKLFHFFSVRSIFIRLCGALQLLSLQRALMNVLGSHPLIICAPNAFRYTLASGCL